MIEEANNRVLPLDERRTLSYKGERSAQEPATIESRTTHSFQNLISNVAGIWRGQRSFQIMEIPWNVRRRSMSPERRTKLELFAHQE